MMMITLVCAASAAPSVLLGAGVEGGTNDPFARNVGLRALVGVEWRDWLQTRAVVSTYPIPGRQRSTQLAELIVQENAVTPDISLPFARAQISAAFPALRARSGGVSGSVGPEIGVGAVYTVDQLWLIDKTDDPEAIATERQLHPTVSFGIVGEMGGRSHGIEARIERASYRETVDGADEHKGTLWLGIAWVWHPGRAE